MRDGIKLSPQSQLSPPLRLSCRPFVRFVLASVHVLSAEVVDWSVVRSVSLGAGSRGRQLEMEVGASAGTVKHTVVKVLTRYHLKEDRQRVRKSSEPLAVQVRRGEGHLQRTQWCFPGRTSLASQQELS